MSNRAGIFAIFMAVTMSHLLQQDRAGTLCHILGHLDNTTVHKDAISNNRQFAKPFSLAKMTVKSLSISK